MGEKTSLNSLIIHPAVEPGVIDNAMLTRCILDYGPTEEAGRLFAEEGVHLDETTVVRLEFKRIIRIDHLWMLTSLTKLTLAHNLIEKIENLELLTGLNELDLSFNKIEKIENLETLVNLEILTLFHNKIRKLENLDALEKLLVFSIGDNLIEDYKEIAYLRRFRFLRSVSFKGNPCCDDPLTNEFFKSALPKVTYFDYKTVTEEAREKAASFFRYLAALNLMQNANEGILRKLDEADEKNEKARLAKEAYDAKIEFHSLCFIEYLSGPELIDTMFEKDVDGQLLMKAGGELIGFYEQYREQFVEAMTEFVEFAQEAYHRREREIKLFKELADNALEDSVKLSLSVVEEFETKKKPLVEQMQDMIAKFTAKQVTLEQLELSLMELGDAFNDILHELWKSLMNLEMRLYEQCEEARGQFSVNMSEIITQLLEVSRNAFGPWREAEGLWAMRLFETLSKYLGNTHMVAELPPELRSILMDVELMMNVVSQSGDFHNRFIDEREDLILTRANNWRDDIVQATNDNEIKRNRDRILEINFFIDNQREEWADMQMELNEIVDPEAAAFLGEDF